MPQENYEIWFGNQSRHAGTACVYQAMENVHANQEIQQIAWMVSGANPSSWKGFTWTLDYDFFWIDQDSNTWQKKPADPEAANSTVLSKNAYGYALSDPSQGAAGTLRITQDATVPAINKAFVGIGMSGAGAFAAPVNPNSVLTFRPQPASSYLWITFGQYTFQVGDVLDPASLNPSSPVRFPSGYTSMTAILDATNSWTVTPGKPSDKLLAGSLLHEAGREFDLRKRPGRIANAKSW